MDEQFKKMLAGKPKPFPTKRFLGFLKKLKIMTKEFGIQPMRLLGTQKYVLAEIEQGLSEGVTSFVILKARQLGMSTFFIALDIFWAFENAGLSGAFACHTDVAKNQFRNVIRLYLANLPADYKIPKVVDSRDLITFENSSMFTYMVAGTKEKTQSNIGRGGAYNFLHATEVAYWGSGEDLPELAATMSTHNPNRLEIIETTANGFNHFHDVWEAATKSKTQRAIFVGWWRNELYQFPEDHPYFLLYMPDGIHTTLTSHERKKVRAIKQEYDVDVTPEQIAWYRWQLDDKQAGDQISMDEKYPWLPEDAFVASGSNFFTSASLTYAMREAKKLPLLPFRYVLGKQWTETGVLPQVNAARGELKIWEEMHPSGLYSIGVDPAFGSSEEADRTVISICRCFSDKLVQVAEFVSASTSTYQCAWVLAHLAGYYRASMVILELSGGAGQTVLDELQRLKVLTSQAPQQGAPDLRNVLASMQQYMYRRIDLLSGQLCYQWKTTAENKFAMLSALKDAFELGRFRASSLYLLQEMKSLVRVDGQLKGEGRKKDDRVMAVGLAHEGWRKWVQQQCISRGISFESAYREQVTGPKSHAESVAIDYLRKAGVLRPGQTLNPVSNVTRADE